MIRSSCLPVRTTITRCIHTTTARNMCTRVGYNAPTLSPVRRSNKCGADVAIPFAVRSISTRTPTASSATDVSPSPTVASSNILTHALASGGWVGRLESECVLRVTGSTPNAPATELLKYLHNLTTQDMYQTVSSTQGIGYTMMLNSKGRVIFDCTFLPIDSASLQWMRQSVELTQPTTKGPAGVAKEGLIAGPATKTIQTEPSNTPRGFYILVHSSAKQAALDHLSQFNLRRKVIIQDLTDHIDVHQAIPYHAVEAIYADPSGASIEPVAASNALASFSDPRSKHMGTKLLVKKGEKPNLPATFHTVPSSFLNTYRILLGISSSPHELLSGTSLPLEHGLVESNGVSFEKGCYLGQELTARTHFQGVVRKRVWPCYMIQRADTPNRHPPNLSELMGRPTPMFLATSNDPLRQLEAFFPFIDLTTAPLTTDATISREAISPPEASTPPSAASSSPPKEVARILSSSHNLALAMLRTEHVEDTTHAFKVEGQTKLDLVPYITTPTAPSK